MVFVTTDGANQRAEIKTLFCTVEVSEEAHRRLVEEYTEEASRPSK